MLRARVSAVCRLPLKLAQSSTLIKALPMATHNFQHRFSTTACARSEVPFSKMTQEEQAILTEERAVDTADVCIVGGGPAGLVTAIRLKQLDTDGKLRVVVLEKSPDFGNHMVSGVILEPRALKELFPESEHEGIPLPAEMVTKCTDEQLRFLWDDFAIPVPEPPQMVNTNGNYIASLSQVAKYLAEKAEEMGVEVFSGISVSEVVYDANGAVRGVATKDMGVSKTGQPKDSFERGMEFHSRVTVLAEGAHGSLSKQVINKFDLRKGAENQTYGLGIKEVWEVKPENFKKGFTAHTMGYPLSNNVYGGGFQYHFGDGLVAVGLVTGLDYANPYISPYMEFQKMKHHPYYANVLKGGKCIAYAARALNEGGLQSVPKLHFPGGVLVGCSAGFVNVPKIKGTHTAMKSGMLAAEAAYAELAKLEPVEDVEELETLDLRSYQEAYKNSWIYEELKEVRNIRPSFGTPLGALGGMIYSGLDSMILKGNVPWTFDHHESDASVTAPAQEYEPIEYEKPDGILSFDILTSVSRTGTYHDEDEKCHLRVGEEQDLDKHCEESYPKYKGVEAKFCPAGVYEYVEDATKPHGVKFQVNSQNCIHCKTCDIKTPAQDINWEVPEGGDGPKYTLT